MTDQTSLARVDGADQGKLTLALVQEMTGYSLTDLALIRHTMSASMGIEDPKKVPLIDIALFLRACQSLGLDPLVRQAYWIRRGTRSSLQIGIDGLRAIADRAGNLIGCEAPTFRGQVRWVYRGAEMLVPEYAEVRAWKVVKGVRGAFVGTAWWTEMVPEERSATQWAKMPRRMLGKVAEAEALRKGWALQLERQQVAAELEEVEAESDSSTEDAAHDEPVVIEQPKRRTYDQVFAEDAAIERGEPIVRTPHGNVDTQTGEVLVDDETDDLPPFESEGESALGLNRRLVEQARRMGMTNLAKYVANDQWPENAIVEANVALESRMMQKNGDADLTTRQAVAIG
jgi:phage recombination protein Bet